MWDLFWTVKGLWGSVAVKTLRRISSDFVGKPKKTSENQKKSRKSSDFFFDFFAFFVFFVFFCPNHVLLQVSAISGLMILVFWSGLWPGVSSSAIPALQAVARRMRPAGANPSFERWVLNDESLGVFENWREEKHKCFF